MAATDRFWFQEFSIESEDRSDAEIVWDDQFDGPKVARVPTRAEKLSIILVGVTAIGFIVLMVATLAVAVYISRN